MQHDAVLFALISDDFVRMQSDTFMGYGRPYMTVLDGELVQENYPVPRRAYDDAQTEEVAQAIYASLQPLFTATLLS